MAMLAEPKRKNKMGPDPRNTFWLKDETRFGFRMLENMGWKKGKGLGAKENGRTENVKAVFRNACDVTGIGFSQSETPRPSETGNSQPFPVIPLSVYRLRQIEEYNKIFTKVKADRQGSNASEKTEETPVDRVEMRTPTRKRFRYPKSLPRLDDIPAEDLTFIFGKPTNVTSTNSASTATISPSTATNSMSTATDSVPTTDSKTSADEDEGRPSFNVEASTPNGIESHDKENQDKDEFEHGVKTYTSCFDMRAYFAKMMKERSLKKEAAASFASDGNMGESVPTSIVENSCTNADETASEVNKDNDADVDISIKKKKKKKKEKRQREEQNEDSRHEEQVENVVQDVAEQEGEPICDNESKKSKRKKRKQLAEQNEDCHLQDIENVNEQSAPFCDNESKKLKKKKKKQHEEQNDDSHLQEQVENVVENGIEPEKAPVCENDTEKCNKSKKKRKQQREEQSDDSNLQEQVENVDEENTPTCEHKTEKSKRKNKKRRDRQNDDSESFVEDVNEKENASICENNESEKCKKPKSKKKKDKQSNSDAHSETNCSDVSQDCQSEEQQSETEQVSKKKKKRKSTEISSDSSEADPSCVEISVNSDIQDDSCESAKTKKKKKKSKKVKEDEKAHNSSILCHNENGKSKKRKSVTFSVDAEIFMIPTKEEDKAAMEKQLLKDKKIAEKRKRENTENEEEEQRPSKKRKKTLLAENSD